MSDVLIGSWSLTISERAYQFINMHFLFSSEVKVIAKPVSDITPINGYLDYPETFASRVVALTTRDNELSEDEKVYSVILVSSRGGAEIDNRSDSKARLTGKFRFINLSVDCKDVYCTCTHCVCIFKS